MGIDAFEMLSSLGLDMLSKLPQTERSIKPEVAAGGGASGGASAAAGGAAKAASPDQKA